MQEQMTVPVNIVRLAVHKRRKADEMLTKISFRHSPDVQ